MKIKYLALLLLVGCATGQSYQSTMNTWINHPASELISSWGYPHQILQNQVGHDVYVYSQSYSVTVPGYQMPATSYTSYSGTYAGQTFANTTTVPGISLPSVSVPRSCTTAFELDENKNIIFIRWEGNNC